MKTNFRQQGVTLLELILAMSIMLVLAQSVTGLMLDLYRHYDSSEKSISANEGQQVALLVLKQMLNQAGHIETLLQRSSLLLQTSIFQQGAFVSAINNAQQKPYMKGSDVLFIRFQTPAYGRLRDCKNTWLEEKTMYQMDFYIDRKGDFRCRGARSSNNYRHSAVLAQSVGDMQLIFAYQDSSGIVWGDAQAIQLKHLWKNIVAIKIQLMPDDGLDAGSAGAWSKYYFQPIEMIFVLSNSEKIIVDLSLSQLEY